MSELNDVAKYINENGIPSTDSMRANIEANERAMIDNPVYEKLDEYRSLFERWKAGEGLSEDETKRMTDLSQELTEIAEKIQGSQKE